MNDNAIIILSALRSWSDGPKHIFIDPDLYTTEVTQLFFGNQQLYREYNVIPSYGRLMEWTKHFSHKIACIVVISNRDYADDMQKIRPDLEIRKVTTE